jgi:predicted Ser/Thr protein kinase
VSEPTSERRLIDSALEQVRSLRERGGEPALAPLPEIPGYELLAELHRGGQGVVYRAIQRATGQEVALKVLRDELSPSARVRFEREVAVLARLRHRNLVAIHDSGLHAGRSYYAMEYVPGRDLDQELAARARDLRAEVELLARVAEAVGAAHLRGVLHRDIKPANIRIDPEGEPRLVDFGLAKRVDEQGSGTETGVFVGSTAWASPEQVEGAPLDLRSDVYSLGVVAYQALTGRFPYDVGGTLARSFEAIRGARPAPPRALRREIDADLETILLTALAKEPGRRYQSALELARDLRRWLGGEPIDARKQSALYLLRKALQRHRLASAAALLVLALLAGSAVAVAVSRARWRDAAGRLEALLHARELQRIAEAFQEGDGELLRALLAAVPPERRDWLHGYFQGRLERRLWSSAPGAGERLLAADVSPDGARLALGSWQGAVRMLSAADGALLWERHELADLRALAFHPDGERLVAAGSEGLALLDAQSGELLRSLADVPGGLEVLSVARGRILAASAAGEALLADLATLEPIRRLHCSHPASAGAGAAGLSGVEVTALDAERGALATAGRGLVRIWDVLADEPRLSLALVEGVGDASATALAFSADGRRLAVGASGTAEAPGFLLVLDVESGAQRVLTERLDGWPTAIAFADGGRLLVGLRSDPGVRVLDELSGEELERLPGAENAAALVHRGGRLALLAGALELWALDPPIAADAAPTAFAAPRGALELDGRRELVLERGELLLRDRKSGATLLAVPTPTREPPEALAYLAGEQLLALGTRDGRITFVDLRHGDLLCSLPVLPDGIEALSYDSARGELHALDAGGRSRVLRGTP